MGPAAYPYESVSRNADTRSSPLGVVAAHTGAGSTLLGLLALAVTVLVFYIIVRWVRRNLSKLGLTPGEVGAILWGTFLGSLVNIPLFGFGDGYLAINVGGAVVPVVLSLFLIRRKKLPFTELIVGIPLVAIVTYVVSRYEPGLGVVSEFPWWILPAVVAFMVAALAYWHEREDSAALAYVCGTLGVLIGADLVRIPEILAGPAPEAGVVLSIGGAAVFDMVYLTGIIAVAMETGVLSKVRQNLTSQSRGNPIEDEYVAWVQRKEREWADVQASRRRETAVKPVHREGRSQQWTPQTRQIGPPGARR